MEGYRSGSRRVRETWARYELGNVLYWAFAPELPGLPEDELEDFLYGVRSRVGATDPTWQPAMELLRGRPVARLRPELTEAFTKIRTIARAIATHQPTAMHRMRVAAWLSAPNADREGHPRWMLSGRLADA